MASFNVTVEDSSPLISYSPAGSWIDSPSNDPLVASYSGSSLHTTSVQNAQATLNFNGTGVYIFGGRRPNYGTFTLAVDGKTVDCSAKSAQAVALQSLCSTTGLPNGSHKVVVTNTGGAAMDIDRIVFQTQLGLVGSKISLYTYDDVNPAMSYLPSSATWKTNNTVESFNKTLHYTQTAGASAVLKFSGGAVALYGTVSPNHADILVTLDGQSKKSTGGTGGFASTTHSQVLLYYQDSLGPGNHTISLSGVTAQGNATYIDIDAITVFSGNGTSATSSTASATTSTASAQSTADNASATTASPSAQTSTAAKGLSKVAIGGIIGGSVVGLLLILGLLWMFLKKRGRKTPSRTSKIDKASISAPTTPELPLQGDPSPGMMEAGFSRVDAEKEAFYVSQPAVPAPAVPSIARHSIAPSYYYAGSTYSDSIYSTNHSRNNSYESMESTDLLIPNIPKPGASAGRKPPPRFSMTDDSPRNMPKRPSRRPPTLDLAAVPESRY